MDERNRNEKKMMMLIRSLSRNESTLASSAKIMSERILELPVPYASDR